MELNCDKYDIEVRDDDTTKSDQTFFNFMQWTFNRLDGLYIHEKMFFDRHDHSKPSDETECSGIWKTEQIKKGQKKRKEGTSKLKKSLFCE